MIFYVNEAARELLFSQAQQRLDHLRAADPHLAPVKHRHFRQHPGSCGREPDENVASVRDSLLPANEAKLFQLVHQSNGGVMFHLEPLAEVADREVPVARKRFQRQERFVLLGRQVRLCRESALAEAKKLAQRVTERGERIVIVGE